MDFNTVLSRLQNLPATFLRSDNTFNAWENSQAFQLSEYTYSADSLAQQTNFSTAYFNWIDVWGELFGIPRNSNESTILYKPRISTLLQYPVGTLFAVQAYSEYFWNTTVTVTENTSGVGYSITLPSSINTSLIPSYLENLQKIRPAGVPFVIKQNFQSTFLNTFSYVGAPGIAGPYLGGGVQTLSVTIPEPITNSQPILPTALLADPILTSQITP